MNYTEQMESALFELDNLEMDEDTFEEKVIDFLNDAESFRTFGDGLKYIIKKKASLDSCIDEKAYLKAAAAQQGIVFNRNTINNWFEGTRPKKGEASREHMYKIAFSLKLTVDETVDLFRKVYLDMPFNMRNIREFIYYYCLNENYPYQHAQLLIDQVEFDAEDDSTVNTRLLGEEVTSFRTDNEVLNYIRNHAHNFHISNRSAMIVKDELLKTILPDDHDKKLRAVSNHYSKEYVMNNAHGIITKELELMTEWESVQGKDITSVSTMLEIIEGINMVKVRENSKVSLFKGANLPKEIINRFPVKHTFSKNDPSYEELRKMIILLFSYCFWYRKTYELTDLDLEDYMDELNELLVSANLQELYYGNPYDWLFLFCTLSEDSLSAFRAIVAEAFAGEML